MSGPVIDLRSDFISRPTPQMIRAMSDAASQPPAFGPREDPSTVDAFAASLETLSQAGGSCHG